MCLSTSLKRRWRKGQKDQSVTASAPTPPRESRLLVLNPSWKAARGQLHLQYKQLQIQQPHFPVSVATWQHCCFQPRCNFPLCENCSAGRWLTFPTSLCSITSETFKTIFATRHLSRQYYIRSGISVHPLLKDLQNTLPRWFMLQLALLWDRRIHWDPSTELETSLTQGEWHKTPLWG